MDESEKQAEPMPRPTPKPRPEPTHHDGSAHATHPIGDVHVINHDPYAPGPYHAHEPYHAPEPYHAHDPYIPRPYTPENELGIINITCKGISVCNPVTVIGDHKEGSTSSRIKGKWDRLVDKARKKKDSWRKPWS